MNVSLVYTVLNEGKTIRSLLDSIAAQTQMPNEVIACDGGSADDTVSILQSETRFPIRVIVENGANISRGRNIAIAAATGEVIACTDAGARLHPEWLKRIVQPFEDGERRNQRVHVVSGFFLPEHDNTFEMAMSATVLPSIRDVRAQTFLPSSRSVAFRRSAWQAVGGYPEWLDFCEDLIFDLKLREQFWQFAFVPDAVVYFKPRGSLRSFFKQYYLYARGDGKADLFFKRHLVRYATYLLVLPILLLGFFISASPLRWGCIVLLLLGVLVYTQTPFRRLFDMWGKLSLYEKLKAIAYVPIIRVVGDAAKMIGYPVGLWWRLKRKSTDLT
jgi:glycosyltransferase involved in cell wall biosynthesis